MTTTTCPHCGEATYRDEIPVPDNGGSKFLYRHESTGRVACPKS
jgi:hypothetical protein